MKKLSKIVLFFGLIAFLASSCSTAQNNCGSKGDHKKRQGKMKKMAPNMHQ